MRRPQQSAANYSTADPIPCEPELLWRGRPLIA